MNVEIEFEFYDASVELPNRSCDVLVYGDGFLGRVQYSYKHKLFNASDDVPKKVARKYAIRVDAWAYIYDAIEQIENGIKNVDFDDSHVVPE